MTKHFARVRVDFLVEFDDEVGLDARFLSSGPRGDELDLEKCFLPPGRWITAGLRALGLLPTRYVRPTKYNVERVDEKGRHV